MVEQWNSDGGTEEQLWWNSGTDIVEQWKSMVEHWSRDGGAVEKLWWNSGTEMVEQRNSYGGTVEQ